MIFGCKADTYAENMSRRVFGLPRQHLEQVERVTDRTALFLFNYTTKVLHGVFVRDGPGGLNLEPEAWAHHKKAGSWGSPYPAQVRFKPYMPQRELPRSVWHHIPGKTQGRFAEHYDLWLDASQAESPSCLAVST